MKILLVLLISILVVTVNAGEDDDWIGMIVDVVDGQFDDGILDGFRCTCVVNPARRCYGRGLIFTPANFKHQYQ